MKEKLQKIHETSLRILKEIGIKLHNAEVLDILRQKGVTLSGQTAFFEPDQIMAWVGKAPEKFTLYARNPQYDIVIGGDHTECTAGYGCTSIVDLEGNKRESILDDYINFAKLTHRCEHFNINGGILVQPCDVPPDKSHLIMLYASMVLTDKCLYSVLSLEKGVQDTMDMMGILFGGRNTLQEKPRALTMISPISPLKMDDATLQAILNAAGNHQPMIVSPCPSLGTTGPISAAGNLALGNAECLAGIAIAQMIEEGTPVIYGLNATDSNLKNGSLSIGSPYYAFQIRHSAEMAKMYGLPCRGGGSLTDAKTLSAQSGYEGMMAMLIAYQKGINLVVHGAGILDSFSGMSYEKFIVDLELISRIKFYLSDMEVNDETLSFDVIKEVGPGGQFLSSPDTLRKCRTHAWNPEISLNGGVNGMSPNEKYLENINRKMEQMLEEYRKPELDDGIKKALDDYMIREGVDREILERISQA